MAVVDSCCFKCSTKTGSVIIGALLLIFCVGFLIVTIGLVAAWEDFDTQFLDDRLSRYGVGCNQRDGINRAHIIYRNLSMVSC